MVVADTVRRGSSPDGLQPLRLARDWRQVIPLIELAFGEDLDAEARRALRSMRLPPGLSGLIASTTGTCAPITGVGGVASPAMSPRNLFNAIPHIH